MPVFLVIFAFFFWPSRNAFSEDVSGFLGFVTFVPLTIDVPDTLVLGLGPPEVVTLTFVILILPEVGFAEDFGLRVTAVFSTAFLAFGPSFFIAGTILSIFAIIISLDYSDFVLICERFFKVNDCSLA
jgi:hypothetical protein